ncbi:MAG: hypothetical protein H7270_02730 [Dermatophilaceae bacterium]|nr:hypothetical protein [Dermatophilaceae bacterium]
MDGVAASHLITFLGGGGNAPYTSCEVAGVPGGAGTLAVDFSKLDDPAAHDPRVGVLGGSYGGQIQFAAAATDSRVDTLVSLITWNDLRYSLAPNSTAQTTGVTYANQTPGAEKIGWRVLFFGVGIADGIQGAGIDPARNVGCPNFVLQACQAKATLDTLGYPTEQTYELTDRVSVGHYLDRVRAPTFLIQGQNGTLFFRDWVKYTGTATPAYRTASSYHVEAPRSYYLSGAGDLVSNPGAVKSGSVSWSNPGLGAIGTYSEVCGLEGQIPAGTLPPDATAPYDAPGTMGAWTTQPLTTDASVVGVATLNVTFTSPTVAATQAAGPARQLQVFAKLYDVAPDGSETLVNRLISPVRLADVTKPVHLEMPGIVHLAAVGHHLQQVLSSTDAAYKNAYSVQPVTVTANPEAPVTLRIPVHPTSR